MHTYTHVRVYICVYIHIIIYLVHDRRHYVQSISTDLVVLEGEVWVEEVGVEEGDWDEEEQGDEEDSPSHNTQCLRSAVHSTHHKVYMYI